MTNIERYQKRVELRKNQHQRVVCLEKSKAASMDQVEEAEIKVLDAEILLENERQKT